METPRDRDDQLAAELRALRPTPHPRFAAELDERVAAGFPRRSRLRWPSFDRLRAKPPRRLLIPAGSVAVLAIAISTAVIATNDRADTDEHGRWRQPPIPDRTRSSGRFRARTRGTVRLKRAAPPQKPAPTSTSTAAAAIPAAAAASATAPSNAPPPSSSAPTPADVGDDSAEVFEAVHAHDGIVMRSSTQRGRPWPGRCHASSC